MNDSDNTLNFPESLVESWLQAGNPPASVPKAILLDIDVLHTPYDTLKRESSNVLIARLAFSLITGEQAEPVSNEQLWRIMPLLDRNSKAVIREETLRRLYPVSKETLCMYRESGLLASRQTKRGCLYDWDQTRELFSGDGERNPSSPSPEK